MSYHYIFLQLKSDRDYGSLVRSNIDQTAWTPPKKIKATELECKYANPTGIRYKEKIYLVIREDRIVNFFNKIIFIEIKEGTVIETDFTSHETIVPFHISSASYVFYQESRGTLNVASLGWENNTPKLASLSTLDKKLKSYDIIGYPSIAQYVGQPGNSPRVFYVNTNGKLASFQINCTRQTIGNPKDYDLEIAGSPSAVVWQDNYIVLYRTNNNNLYCALFNAIESGDAEEGDFIEKYNLSESSIIRAFSSPSIILDDENNLLYIYFIGGDSKLRKSTIDMSMKLPNISVSTVIDSEYDFSYSSGAAPFAISSDKRLD